MEVTKLGKWMKRCAFALATRFFVGRLHGKREYTEFIHL